MLPEEILARILSLMPTKYAVRTSVLSKRWRYTWTSVTNLDFDYTRLDPFMEDCLTEFVDGNEKNFVKFVDRVLNFRKSSHVKLFRLHISNYHHLIRSRVSNWVDNAVMLNVHELDIRLIHFKLPLSVFTSKTLTNLRLELSACDLNSWEFPSQIYLPCLKTLDVTGCRNPLVVIPGCPVLESLSSEVICCRHKEVCIFNIPTLKRLKLVYRSGANYENNKVVLRVPKLEYLFVGGVFSSVFVMEDVSSLVGVSIACWTGRNSLWADLLSKVRGVRHLSIENTRIENFPYISPLPIFPNIKRLELNDVWKSGQITRFLESCPELKIFCIDAIDWRDFKKRKPEGVSWIEFEPKLIPACMLTNLTTIKVSKCEGDTSDMEFLEYMLGNAQVLKTVTIFALENLLVEEDPWFCAKVLKFPRASPHCEIHFRSWKRPPPPPQPIDLAL